MISTQVILAILLVLGVAFMIGSSAKEGFKEKAAFRIGLSLCLISMAATLQTIADHLLAILKAL